MFLDDADTHPRVRERIDLTAEIIAPGAAQVLRAESRGQTAVERVFSLVLLGDLVSLYMAVLRGVDPAARRAARAAQAPARTRLAPARGGGQQAQLAGAGDGLDAAVGVELGVDVAHVRADGVRRDEQLGGDLRAP